MILCEHSRATAQILGFAISCLTICIVELPGLTAARGSESSNAESPIGADPFLWLEDVTGQKALDWVRQQNAVSTNELESAPEFEPIRQRLLSIMDSKERIPYVAKHGAWYYNFWRDQNNPRGLWRRTTLKEFKKPHPAWETVLDLDQLSSNEKE